MPCGSLAGRAPEHFHVVALEPSRRRERGCGIAELTVQAAECVIDRGRASQRPVGAEGHGIGKPRIERRGARPLLDPAESLRVDNPVAAQQQLGAARVDQHVEQIQAIDARDDDVPGESQRAVDRQPREGCRLGGRPVVSRVGGGFGTCAVIRDLGLRVPPIRWRRVRRDARDRAIRQHVHTNRGLEHGDAIDALREEQVADAGRAARVVADCRQPVSDRRARGRSDARWQQRARVSRRSGSGARRTSRDDRADAASRTRD